MLVSVYVQAVRGERRWRRQRGPSLASPARADFPYPTCADAAARTPRTSRPTCSSRRASCRTTSSGGGTWKYLPDYGHERAPARGRRRPADPTSFGGDPRQRHPLERAQVARSLRLNAGELPIPPGCAAQDCNGDGFVSVDDYAATPDGNGNGFRDGQDLILAFSDGVDDDGNGYVDDIAGWDFHDDDNDPFDDVDYGHGTGEAEDSGRPRPNNGGGLPGFAPSSLLRAAPRGRQLRRRSATTSRRRSSSRSTAAST